MCTRQTNAGTEVNVAGRRKGDLGSGLSRAMLSCQGEVEYERMKRGQGQPTRRG